MNKFILHAYGVDGIQITESQKDNLKKLCDSPSSAGKMVDINGYMVKVSAIMTIEPTEEQPKQYLIDQYNREASKGLHAPYAKRLTAQERLSEHQSMITEEVMQTDPEDRSYMWENAPKREHFLNMNEYIKARRDFMVEKFGKKKGN